MYKLAISTNTIRCTKPPTRVNLISHIKLAKQIRTINIQQTNVTGYHGRGEKSADKSFERAEKDRAERALLYSNMQKQTRNLEKQKIKKKYPASILKAEEITKQVLNEVDNKNFDEALRIFQENKAAGIQFGTRGYVAALKLLAQKQDLATAEKYFDDSVKEKVPLHVDMIDHILAGFAAQKNLDVVKKYFQKIEELKLTPTTASFNALLAVVHTEEEIVKTVEELKNKGVQPNVQTYTIAMRKLSHLNKFDRVWDLYQEARANHVTPLPSFWVQIINSCAKFGHIDYLEKVLVHLVDIHQTQLDYRHWTALVRAFSSLGRWDRVYDMFDEIRQRKAPMDPNIVYAFTSAVRASDLIRGYLEFPLNHIHLLASKAAAQQSPKLDSNLTKMFLGLLNDTKPTLVANIFTPPPVPPAPVATTTTTAPTQPAAQV